VPVLLVSEDESRVDDCDAPSTVSSETSVRAPQASKNTAAMLGQTAPFATLLCRAITAQHAPKPRRGKVHTFCPVFATDTG
jgi:hypothetical protein